MVSPTRLIASSKVTGTAVFNTAGDHLGHIDEVMIDKPSGKVAYAVLAFGGFLGFNDKHFPVPWSSLRYDVARDGYVIDIDRQTLAGAPVYAGEWTDMGWGRVDDYYGARPDDDEIPLIAAG